MSHPDQLDHVALARGFLITQPALLAMVGGEERRISGRLFRGWKPLERAVRLTRVGGTPTDWTGYLQRARVQVEAFAEDEPTAFELAAAVLRDLHELAGRTIAPAVFTAVEDDLGLREQADPPTGAPRVLGGVVLYAHPAAS